MIRKTRLDNGVTQEALAYLAGINRSYMGFVERGEKHASIATINKIATALKIDLYKLFDMHGNTKGKNK